MLSRSCVVTIYKCTNPSALYILQQFYRIGGPQCSLYALKDIVRVKQEPDAEKVSMDPKHEEGIKGDDYFKDEMQSEEKKEIPSGSQGQDRKRQRLPCGCGRKTNAACPLSPLSPVTKSACQPLSDTVKEYVLLRHLPSVSLVRYSPAFGARASTNYYLSILSPPPALRSTYPPRAPAIPCVGYHLSVKPSNPPPLLCNPPPLSPPASAREVLRASATLLAG